MKRYSVSVTREGRWWMVSVPALDLLTQARRLDEVESMARSLISVALDVAPGSFELDLTARLNRRSKDDLLAVGAELDHLRAVAADAEAAVQRRLREVANELANAEVPTRDIGRVIGVSHQRVSQLVGA